MNILKINGKLKIIIIFFIGFFLMNSVIVVLGESHVISFYATPGDTFVLLEWETEMEPDLDGFYILRSNHSDRDYSRLNNLIASQGSEDSGLVYQFTDSNVVNGQIYFYKLEIIHSNNESEFFGLISVIPNQIISTTTIATSVTLTSTIFLSPTISQTPLMTSSLSPTSRFSFVTNTRTPSPTLTPIITKTYTETPDLTSSSIYKVSRTFEIKSIGQITPTDIVDIPKKDPFQRGLIGFGISVVIGMVLLSFLVLLQKKSSSKQICR